MMPIIIAGNIDEHYRQALDMAKYNESDKI